MANTRIFGYSNPLYAKIGEKFDFHISAEGTNEVNSEIVRLIHGDENPDGPGFVEEKINSGFPKKISVNRQYTQLGSYAVVDDKKNHLNNLKDFSLYAFVYPTGTFGNSLNTQEKLKASGKGRQCIIGNWSVNETKGYALGINNEGHLEFWIGDGKIVEYVKCEVPIVANFWFLVAATYNSKKRKATIYQIGAQNQWNSLEGTHVEIDFNSVVSETFSISPKPTSKSFIFAGAHESNTDRGDFISLLYNGKIDTPGVTDFELTYDEVFKILKEERPIKHVASWDTTLGYDDNGIDDVIHDIGPNKINAYGHNRPVRGMTGWNWKGKDDCFRLNPKEYGGVSFHDDALIDCNWSISESWTPRENDKSGVYALKITSKDKEDYIPFFVTPKKPKAKIAVQMATFTYLAYANLALYFDGSLTQAIYGMTPIISEEDIELYKLSEFGLSTYDHHSDGEGVCFSSWKRPILNMRPKFRGGGVSFPWAFPADLSLLWWLENENYDFEIITDHDVHYKGSKVLQNYKAVINVTHPEYYSTEMLDATEEYLRNGGRFLYLGGNGYYWVTTTCRNDPSCIEVRKLDAGTRAWEAKAGECYLMSSGERSGIWRSRGRAPQKLMGVGFTSEGMDRSEPFERMPDSFHKKVSWIFEGIGDKEIIGDFGLALGGAAGVEIDRYDLSLGTPINSKLLASSYGHSDNYPLVSEDITFNYPGRGGTQDPQVRSDIVFFNTLNNGAVFSVGSIAWSQALPCFKGKNNVGKIMHNVLKAFIKDGPLPGSKYIGEEKHWR